jgi:hypothetical protein
MHMIVDGPGNTDSSGWTLGLEASRDIYCVTVQVSAFRNGITDVDPDPEPDSPVRRLVCIENWNMLLHLQCEPHSTFHAIEGDQEGVPASVYQPATVLRDRRIDQFPPERLKPF